jgi:hypothetical protein
LRKTAYSAAIVYPSLSALDFGDEGLSATELFCCLNLCQAGLVAILAEKLNQIVVDLAKNSFG